MERNDESLSTRDLASPNDPPAGAVTDPEHGAGRRQSEASDPGASVQVDDQTQAPAPPGNEFETQSGDAGLDTQQPAGEGRSGPPPAAGDAATASPASTQGAAARSTGSESGDSEPLLTVELSATFQRRWEQVQTRFVDEPRGAVEDADGLVANVMQQLAEGFAQERERLEAQWGRGEDISTEDLRVALQRYRSFFHRLLST